MIRLSYIYTIILSFCCVFISCKSNHKTDKDESNSTVSEIENDSEIDEPYTLVPLIFNGEEDNEGFILIRGIALRNQSGEYLMYDNDADYTYLTPYFIQIKYLDSTEANLFHYGKTEVGKVEELLLQFNSRYDAAKLYLDGHKSEISDPVLRERIERSHYNGLKNIAGYHEDYSSYNYKRYKDNENKRSMVVRPNKLNRTIPVGAPTIPDGALIIDK